MRVIEAEIDACVGAVLLARVVIARYGQRDAMDWWNDESLTPSGTFVMQRLFPRTAPWVQAETAIEAATLRHEDLVPQPARVTLFRLPPLLESTVRKSLLSLKRTGSDQRLIAQLQIVDVRQPLAETICALGVTTRQDIDAIQTGAAPTTVLALGSIQREQLEAGDEARKIVQRLAAGYALGSRGNLVVPFYELGR